MEMRSSLTEKDDQKTLKAKMRERARPKMGKIDIDYQKLHDAFFKLVSVLLEFPWLFVCNSVILILGGRPNLN